jgi:hypothetical protein
MNASTFEQIRRIVVDSNLVDKFVQQAWIDIAGDIIPVLFLVTIAFAFRYWACWLRGRGGPSGSHFDKDDALLFNRAARVSSWVFFLLATVLVAKVGVNAIQLHSAPEVYIIKDLISTIRH